MNKILISHRGNIDGRNPEMENHPDYIKKALDLDYNVEVDIWYIDNKFYLGHDEPKYEINEEFLKNTNLWFHCKNLNAVEQIIILSICYKSGHSKVFWHQTDDITLVFPYHYIWTYPNKQLIRDSIAVLPELYPDWDISNAIGICSDYISKYKS